MSDTPTLASELRTMWRYEWRPAIARTAAAKTDKWAMIALGVAVVLPSISKKLTEWGHTR